MSKFHAKIFDEPSLEFGEQQHHPDPRLGLILSGPLQAPLGDTIRIGVVGSAKTVEDTKRYFAAVAGGLQGKTEKHPNLHPDFPGLGNQNPFHCKFDIVDAAILALTKINWNSTQMNQKLPIPIRAARKVGEVLKYVTAGKVSSDYGKYI